MSANKAFSGNYVPKKKKFRYKAISKFHLTQMYGNYFILHYINDPKCLQHKVYLGIAFFLVRGVLKAFVR